MRWSIHNGSWLCNALLVLGGAALGVGMTLVWKDGGALSFSAAAVSAADHPRSPSRESALNRRGGDPSVKMRQILQANDPSHKIEDLRQLGREMAADDLPKALEMAKGLKNEDDKLAFFQGVMTSWGAQNPQAAAEYAQTSFLPGGLQSEALTIALGQWGGQSPRAAYIWAEENLSGPLKDEGINSLVGSWVKYNPTDAANWYEQTGQTNFGLLTSLAGTWAKNDPAAAAKWVDQLPNDKNKEIGQVAVAGSWAAKNPEEAAKHYEPVLSTTAAAQPPTTAINLATVLADIWGTTNPSAAASWVSQLPEGPARQEAAGTLASVWASHDIQAATKWSESLDAALRGQVVEHLATTWGAIEPDKALAWIATQPQPFQTDALKGAYNSWAGTDPVGLQDWLDHGYAAAASDIARQSLADVYMDSNPEQALELARGIQSTTTQAEAMGRYFRKWRSTDANSAQDWLNGVWSNLPSGVQRKLESELTR